MICTTWHGAVLRSMDRSWRTFIQPTINWTYILIYACIAVAMGFFSALIRSALYSLTIFGQSPSWDSFQYGFQQNVQSWNVAIAASIFTFFLILILVMIAGLAMRKTLFAFILKEPTWFDAGDYLAMSLSVHKSILRSLDMACIDVSKLRTKGEFKGGRRGEGV